MKIYIPNMELVEILKFAKDLFYRIPEEEEVVFDFSKISHFDPLSMLILGTTIQSYREKFLEQIFYVEGIDDKSREDTMGFFPYISKSAGIENQPDQVHEGGSYIPIISINVQELRKDEIAKGNYMVLGDLIEKEAGRLAHFFDQGDKEVHRLLTYLIRELLRNTPEHSGTNTMWICGQYDPSYEMAEIAVADEGMGLFRSLTQNAFHKEYITDNEKALQWAMKAGISKAFKPSMKQKSNDEWENSGFGLYMVSEICKSLNGSFCIVSYGNYMLIDNDKIVYGETNFNGTAVKIRVPFKGISNAQDLISRIANQGEMEARTIRHAFKNASTPSKGLMTELHMDV